MCIDRKVAQQRKLSEAPVMDAGAHIRKGRSSATVGPIDIDPQDRISDPDR